jgi:hypothetical protein
MTVMFGWPLILGMHCFGRNEGWWIGRRLCRGKYWRWVRRQFGPTEDIFIFLSMFFAAIATKIAFDSMVGSDVVYGYLAICLIIDWITGSEDPPWRKLSRAGNKLLEKLKPMPKPVFQP